MLPSSMLQSKPFYSPSLRPCYATPASWTARLSANFFFRRFQNKRRFWIDRCEKDIQYLSVFPFFLTLRLILLSRAIPPCGTVFLPQSPSFFCYRLLSAIRWARLVLNRQPIFLSPSVLSSAYTHAPMGTLTSLQATLFVFFSEERACPPARGHTPFFLFFLLGFPPEE